MKFVILTTESKTEHEVAWIEANTPEGNFVIQPQHAPTTLILSPAKDLIYCLKTGKHEVVTPKKGGLLHINTEGATTLIF